MQHYSNEIYLPRYLWITKVNGTLGYYGTIVIIKPLCTMNFKLVVKPEGMVNKHLHSRFVSSYRKSLIKKFMFQVHPDFFHNHKALQQINATNLSALQNLLNEGHTVQSGAKSLTFYLKPELSDSKPQKVKLSVSRIENSIMEILETIGVGIPIDQSNESPFYSTQSTMLATPKQTLDFLNSMYERRSLIDWREQRCADLVSIEKVRQCSINRDNY